MRASSKKGKRNILAVECAVGGGSVALISAQHGTILRNEADECSRAEKIILVIAGLLEEVGLTLPDLDMIAVSRGPGSYSGIRIALSTAIGLGSALSVPCVGVSVLDAMAEAAEIREPLIAAVPVGRNDVAFRPYEVRKDGTRTATRQPELLSSSLFVDGLKHLPGFTLFAQRDLFVRLTGRVSSTISLIDAGNGLAEYVARFASREDRAATSVRPIYLRNTAPDIRPKAF